MKAIILVGGEGIRLQPLTNSTAKTMVPVLNKPFLEYVIRHVKNHDVNEIVLTLCHKPHQIEEYFGNGSKFNTHLSYIVEDFPLGTAGAVKNAQQYIAESFFVLNGDIFTDLNLSDMLDFHRQKRAKVTIALTPVDDPTLYGVVECDVQDRVTRFLEKPPRGKVTTNLVNAGVYVLEPDILNYIPENSFSMLEHHLFPKLVAEGVPLFGYPFHDYWIDIGTPVKYRKLNYDLLLGKSNQIKEYRRGDEIRAEEETFIHPTARLKGPVLIGKSCVINKRVSLIGPAVLGAGCKIGDDSVLTGVILWKNVEIGRKVALNNCTISNDSRLQDNSRVEDDSVLGYSVIIAKGVTVPAASRIMPGIRLDSN